MQVLRSVLAVVAGFAAAFVIVVIVTLAAAAALGLTEGSVTPLYLMLNLLGSALAAIAGGYVAARLAPSAPMQHGIALAIVMLLLSLSAVFSEPQPGQPGWYPVTIAIVGLVLTPVGSWMYARGERDDAAAVA